MKTVIILNLPHVVTKVNKRVELAKNQLTDLIQEFLKLSSRKAFNIVKLSFVCVRSFLKEDLPLKTYKEHRYHTFLPADYARKG